MVYLALHLPCLPPTPCCAHTRAHHCVLPPGSLTVLTPVPPGSMSVPTPATLLYPGLGPFQSLAVPALNLPGTLSVPSPVPAQTPRCAHHLPCWFKLEVTESHSHLTAGLKELVGFDPILSRQVSPSPKERYVAVSAEMPGTDWAWSLTDVFSMLAGWHVGTLPCCCLCSLSSGDTQRRSISKALQRPEVGGRFQ